MIKKYKSLSNKIEFKKLFDNYISLFSLQGVNYLLLIITLPYLVRVLGPEKYGLISFATAIIIYIQIITDFGFNLTATREVSIHRNNIKKISIIYGSVFLIKTSLVIICFIALVCVVAFVKKINAESLFYLLWYGVVVGNALMPIWLFQGLESMRYIAKINILVKFIFAVFVFIFVKKPSDYILVPIINSIGYICVGLWSLYLVKKDFKINLLIPEYRHIKHYFFEGLYVFISNVSVSLYTASSVIILGLMTNNSMVGYYAAGEKIIQAVQGVMTPFYRAIYPYNVKKINANIDDGLKVIRKMTHVIGFIMLIFAFTLYFLSEKIVLLVLGPDYYKTIEIVKILSLVPFFSGLSNIFGQQTMLSLNMKKTFTSILVVLSLVNIPISIILVNKYSYIGSALTLLVIEFMGTLLMLFFLSRNKIKVM